MNLYKQFFQKYNKPAIISDAEDGKIIEINEVVSDLFGKTMEDFTNLKRTDIFPQKAIKELDKQLKNNKENSSADTFIFNKDGDKINVEINSQILTEENKKIYLDTISILTEKAGYTEKINLAEAERLVKESEVKYKTLFESANDAIFIIKNDSIIEMNSRALEIFKSRKEDLLGRKPDELSPEFQPDGTSSFEQMIERNKKALSGESQYFDWRHKRQDGSLFDAEVSLNSIILSTEIVIQAIVRDITGRKLAESEVIKSRKSLANLLGNLPGVAYRCRNDENWTMEFVSEGCFTLTGYQYNQLLNNKDIAYGDLIYKDDKEYVWHFIQDAVKDKESFQIIYRIHTADHKIKWVWEQGTGIYSDATGELLYIEGLINDITEQKLTEEALKSSEEKFRSLVEESLVGVYIIQDGEFPYVNPKLAEIFGYTTDEFQEKKIFDLIYEPDKELVKDNIDLRLSGKVDTMHYSFRGVKKDNSLIEVEVMGSHTKFNDKPALIGTILDVTEKSRAESVIRKLSRAVEQSPASIIITDTEGNIEFVNSKFSEITGYSLEEVKGKNPKILKYGHTPLNYYQNLWKTIKSGEEWRGEFLNKKKNGELFWEFASISPIKDGKDNIINFLAVKEDITERKNFEEELKIAKDRAEEMNRLKSVFLANMSHELRTPMVAVLGYSEILKNEIQNHDLKEMANEIFESSSRFMNTLNLILDLSRIESNREVINLTELDIVSVIKEEFDFFKQLASRKKLQMMFSLPEEPIITLLDERMLRQVISNLTGNAVKFTNKGTISLAIYKQIEDHDRKFVIIKISDTGIGIPKNNQTTIFDAFRQISEGLNKNFEGSGLGLTVSKNFIEMMQGTIDVESEFGKGSTFIIKFPIFRRFDIQPLSLDPLQMNLEFPEKSNENIPGLLLVEDDLSNAGVIKFFLNNMYSIDTVLKGEDAVSKAGSKKYAAVLMDIDLGTGMSGLEAAKKIRRIPGNENIPIIAVTALAMRGDREKFLSEGCTHYIAKPYKKEDLIRIIKEATEQSG